MKNYNKTIKKDKEYEILIPNENGGAFVLVYKNISPAIYDLAKSNKILSVRTFLDEDKISNHQFYRMKNFEIYKGTIMTNDHYKKMIEWLNKNMQEIN